MTINKFRGLFSIFFIFYLGITGCYADATYEDSEQLPKTKTDAYDNQERENSQQGRVVPVIDPEAELVETETAPKLKLKIEGISKKGGSICYSVFDSPDRFGDVDSTGYILADCEPIPDCEDNCKDYEFEISIEGLEPGFEFAIAAFHDTNGNSIIDRTGFGIPKEGAGFSNNPNILEFAGIPPFEKCKFKWTDTNKSINLKLLYLL